MTCGIYKLIFGSTSYYVGKSTNIEQRFNRHLTNLKNNLSNSKLQKAYELHGVPRYCILEECDIDDLNEKEIYYISLLDTVKNGLNIAAGGEYFNSGIHNPNSKYSRDLLEEAFLYIVNNPDVSILQISKIYNINYNTLFDLAKCKSHIWLKEAYPKEYVLLETMKHTRVKSNGKNGKTAADLGIEYPQLVSPSGILFTISNVSAFIKQHNLSARLYDLLKGRVSTYKGWRVHTGELS